MNISVSDIRFCQLAEQLDDLRLDRDVERGHAFVGDDQPRVDGERARDAGALALAAAHRARLAVGELALQPDQVEQLAARVPGCARRRPCPAPAAPRPASGRPSPGVERVVRVLEDHRRLAPQRRRAQLRDSVRCRRRRSGSCPTMAGVSPRMARASVLLPLPDSPTMPTVSPGMTRRLTPFDARRPAPPLGEQAAAVGEAHLQVSRSSSSGAARRRRLGCGRCGGVSVAPAARAGWRSASRGVGMARCGEQRRASSPTSTIRPSHITAMRSQVWATTPRSWVIRMIERPRRSRMSISSRRICAWIVTSSAVVGSSAIRIFGIAGQRRRDHRALAHAAGELVRIAVVLARRIRKADLREHSIAAARARLGRPARWWKRMPSAIWSPIAHDRIEVAGRVLEDHADLAAAHRAHLGLAAPSSGRARRACTEPAADRAAGCDGSRRTSARQSRLLPEPLSPTSPSTSPVREVERHVIEQRARARRRRHGRRSGRGPRAAARSLVHPEAVGQPVAEQAEAEGERRRSRAPGNSVIHQAVVMKFWPSATITPHSAVGGCTPRPR